MKYILYFISYSLMTIWYFVWHFKVPENNNFLEYVKEQENYEYPDTYE